MCGVTPIPPVDDETSRSSVTNRGRDEPVRSPEGGRWFGVDRAWIGRPPRMRTVCSLPPDPPDSLMTPDRIVPGAAAADPAGSPLLCNPPPPPPSSGVTSAVCVRARFHVSLRGLTLV